MLGTIIYIWIHVHSVPKIFPGETMKNTLYIFIYHDSWCFSKLIWWKKYASLPDYFCVLPYSNIFRRALRHWVEVAKLLAEAPCCSFEFPGRWPLVSWDSWWDSLMHALWGYTYMYIHIYGYMYMHIVYVYIYYHIIYIYIIIYTVHIWNFETLILGRK